MLSRGFRVTIYNALINLMMCFIDNFKKAARKKLLTIVVLMAPSAESKLFYSTLSPSVI
jgi:hypothetical protein